MKASVLTKQEIFMPTLGRVAFAFIPAIYGIVLWTLASGNSYIPELPRFLEFLIAVLAVFMFFATQFLVLPSLLFLDPLGWWDFGPTKEGYIVVLVGYTIIFYFVFPTRRIVWAEIRKMLGK